MAVSSSPRPTSPRRDYAWVVLGILLAMLVLNQGDRAFFGNFFKTLQEQFATNRAGLSLAVTFNTIISGAVQPIWGRVFDRYGPRAVIVPSSMAVAIGFALLPAATELWQLYLYFGILVGVGLGGTSASIGFAWAARWFRQRRAFAFGLLAAGGMVGSFVMVPGTMFLLLNLGPHWTLLIVAALSVLVAAPLAFGLVPAQPVEARATPPGPVTRAGDPPKSGSLMVPAEARVGIGQAIRTWTFWLLAIPSWVSGFCGTLVQIHVIPMLTDRGFDPQLAANAVGLISGIGIVGVIGGGVLAPRFGERTVLAAIYLVRALGVIALAFTHDLPLLYVSVILIGLSWGGVQPMVGGLTGDAFGRGSLASILGWIFMTQNVLGASAAILGGAVYDLTGDYLSLVLATGLLLLVGVPMSLAIRRAPRTERAAIGRQPSAIGRR